MNNWLIFTWIIVALYSIFVGYLYISHQIKMRQLYNSVKELKLNVLELNVCYYINGLRAKKV